ncbi:hypothetical protein CYY_006161 [Polysphondylium violaceum]|uniref:RNA helicase n=1 Tax=Polysphondylium violaceum TaxID=133409 RepID=A0A8J4PRS6_9MYCE|nr:hypothetical protein CYY_006161 [Polysphondylium violaceum]
MFRLFKTTTTTPLFNLRGLFNTTQTRLIGSSSSSNRGISFGAQNNNNSNYRSNQFSRSNNNNNNYNNNNNEQDDFSFIESSGGRGKILGDNNYRIDKRVTDWERETLAEIKKQIYTPSEPVDTKVINQFLADNNIAVESRQQIPMPMTTFEGTPFNEKIVRMLKSTFDTPTPIQQLGWSISLTGEDFIGISKTGSGKTLSFVLPAIHHIHNQARSHTYLGPSVLIIAPTRELSTQIAAESKPYLQALNMRYASLYGGESKSLQTAQLRKQPQFIVGTPGRILDHLNDGTLSLKNISFLVLDEADRMLEMGFESQVRSLFENIRPDRQVLYWSATWPSKVMNLANEFIINPIKIQVGNNELTANDAIKQNFKFVETEAHKATALLDTMEEIYTKNPEAKTLIFTMTKQGADKLKEYLTKKGNARIESLHGDKAQNHRSRIIDDFKKNHIDILVATDVASRGLDIKDITDVINFSMPPQIENYVHRIGRTARAGATGHSHTIISKSSVNDMELLNELIDLLERSNQEVPREMVELAPQKNNKRYNNNNNNYNRNRNNNNNRRGGGGGGGYRSQRSGPISFGGKK